tara:strand:- start:390 stop:602 length:213 start_codon:yes stop_codon:yes gene_type:complete
MKGKNALASVEGPPTEEGGIGGVSDTASTAQQQLSPAEEKKQLKDDLAKAKAENEAQQKVSADAQKVELH